MTTFDSIRTLVAFLATRLHRNEDGAAMVEYGMLVALIAVVCVGVVGTLGGQISNAFSSITKALAAAGV